MATRVARGKIRLAAFDGLFPKNFFTDAKNLADISYTSRVIANFVPDFVAMATEVGRGRMRLAAFNGPSPLTPYRRHGNGGQSGVNINVIVN